MNSERKLKSKFIKLILSIIIIMGVFAFVENVLSLNVVSAVDGGDIADGISGILLYPAKFIPLIAGKIMSMIMALFTGGGATLTLGDIIFNKIEITKIDFFNFNTSSEAVKEIRMSVATWYYAFRNIAAVILIVVLLYTGLRLATATVSEKKAKYSEMLINWIMSIALLFVLHYLIQFIITINNQLVNLLASSYEQADLSEPMDLMFNQSLKSIGFTKEMGSAICYVILVGMTFVFLLSYLKRMVTIAFLIVIAPLVTITYSIDKMNDGKSQALNTWFKEFTYNVLIQLFHCLSYLVLVEAGLKILQNSKSISAIIVSMIMVYFMYSAEKIVKHIFHFESRTMSDSVKHAAVMSAALGTFNGLGIRKGNRYANLEEPDEDDNNITQETNQTQPRTGNVNQNNNEEFNTEVVGSNDNNVNNTNNLNNNGNSYAAPNVVYAKGNSNGKKKNSRVGRALASVARNPVVSTYVNVNRTLGNMMLSGGLAVSVGDKRVILPSQLQSISNGINEGKEDSVMRNQYNLQMDYNELEQQKEQEIIDSRVNEEMKKVNKSKLSRKEIKKLQEEMMQKINREEGKGIRRKAHNYAKGIMEETASGEVPKNDTTKRISRHINKLRASYANQGMKEDKINEQIKTDFGKIQKGEYKEGSTIEKDVKNVAQGAKDAANVITSPIRDTRKYFKRK